MNNLLEDIFDIRMFLLDNYYHVELEQYLAVIDSLNRIEDYVRQNNVS
ncbi:MAG: hypothetical protein PHX40_03790 [Bacilli bacterium]|nr:hypothetical protein [Bacilli bacterium]